jgi:hypothetical protein
MTGSMSFHCSSLKGFQGILYPLPNPEILTKSYRIGSRLEEKQVKEIRNSTPNPGEFPLKTINRAGFCDLFDLLEQVCLCHCAILSCA